ncbi:UMP/CMP kinase [Malassezia psittaci]|uniref:UMP/CMP kinase n=1 Tax=Malassezia psittaci TaxID=1821823 RepID=A0AAF0F612_9BASI|nr:UMP/CMP kinase [Malassezia psittaci]
MIAEYIKEGRIIPMEVTISLLRNAIQDALEKNNSSTKEGWGHGHGRFLIDGFPRKLDQLFKFEESVVPAQLTLFLRCTEDTMLKRLLHRGETSGRTDDNVESIKKRFRTFEETSMPVVDHLRKQNSVVEVDSVKPVDEVNQAICHALDNRFRKIEQS